MSYSTKEGFIKINGVVMNEFVFDADFVSDPVETRNLEAGMILLTWTNAAAVDGVVALQLALAEAGPWLTVGDATLGTPSGAFPAGVADVNVPYLRLIGTANTENAAKLTTRFYFRGAR